MNPGTIVAPVVHELLCWPEKFDAIKTHAANATARRCDDRHFNVGDEIVFVAATNTGPLYPREEIRAYITRIDRTAGPHQLAGRDDAGNVVPFALIHFVSYRYSKASRPTVSA